MPRSSDEPSRYCLILRANHVCIPIMSAFPVQAIRHSVLPYILFNSRRCYAHSTVLYPSYIYPRLSLYHQLLGLIPLGLHCILHSFPLVVVLLHVTGPFTRSRYGLSIASMYHLHRSSLVGEHSLLPVSTQAGGYGRYAPSACQWSAHSSTERGCLEAMCRSGFLRTLSQRLAPSLWLQPHRERRQPLLQPY